MVVPVHLDFQGCQVGNHPVHMTVLFVVIIVSALMQSLLYLSLHLKVQRETQVFPVLLALQVSPALKERLVSPALQVLQATAAPLGLRDWLFRAPKDSQDPQDHLEEEVKHLDLVFATTCTVRKRCCLVF